MPAAYGLLHFAPLPLTSALMPAPGASPGRESLTVVESGVQWRTVGPGSVMWYRQWGIGEVTAGVPRHSHASPRREGPPVPAREVPRRAGPRAGDHQGAGALPLRFSAARVRPHHRGAARGA